MPYSIRREISSSFGNERQSGTARSRLTRQARSIEGRSHVMPGPASRCTRPSRKTRSRSGSRVRRRPVATTRARMSNRIQGLTICALMPPKAWALSCATRRPVANEAPRFQCQTVPQVMSPTHKRVNCSALKGGRTRPHHGKAVRPPSSGDPAGRSTSVGNRSGSGRPQRGCSRRQRDRAPRP